jgi:hypothetical protein
VAALKGHKIAGESLVIIWVMTCLIISAFGKLLNKKYNIPYIPFIYITSAFIGAQNNNLGYYVHEMIKTIT